jgi:integrase/recombinase XerD
MAMDQLIDDYLVDCQSRGMAIWSMPRYRSVLRIYQQYLAQREADVLAVDNAVLRGFIDYLRARKARSKTLKTYFSVISSFYEFLVFEGKISANPVIRIRKRYLKSYKDNHDSEERQLITVDEMASMINSEMNIRDKAIITLLAKTGIRRNELVSLDVSDVDFVEQKIRLKPTAKRTNRTVFFDDETAFILRRWLRMREDVNRRKETALFLSTQGFRLCRTTVYLAVTNAAERVGLHDPKSERLEDHFSPHACRHWNATHLLRAGMKREYVQWLRGDAIKEAVDSYFHIDPKDVQEAYLAAIPQLGI